MPISASQTRRLIGAGTVVAALAAGAFALGAGAGAPAATASTPGASGARITVTGTGRVSGTPNQLKLSMGVQTNAASVSTALAQANQAVRAVTRSLETNGVQASDIQTSGLSIQPNYGRSGTPTGYGVNESISVTLTNLSDAGTQINRAVHAGGNATTVDGVSLNLSDSGPLMQSARARAVADAKAKAGAYARALGVPLGPVVSLSEQAPQQLVPIFANAIAKSAGVPVSAGTQSVSVSVTVVFSLG